MTTLEELVLLEPEPTNGHPVVRPGGSWRWVVELADPFAGVDVEWHDVTDWYVGDEITRAGAGIGLPFEPSSGTVQLAADDDSLSPTNDDTSPLFGTHVDLRSGLLMRAGLIRVAGGSVAEWQPTWTMQVEEWHDQSRGLGWVNTHDIDLRDLASQLVDVPVLCEDGELGWKLRADEVLKAADWQFGYDIYGADDAPYPAYDGDRVAPSAIAELTAICATAGAVWRVRRNGRLLVCQDPTTTYHADLIGA